MTRHAPGYGRGYLLARFVSPQGQATCYSYTFDVYYDYEIVLLIYIYIHIYRRDVGSSDNMRCCLCLGPWGPVAVALAAQVTTPGSAICADRARPLQLRRLCAVEALAVVTVAHVSVADQSAHDHSRAQRVPSVSSEPPPARSASAARARLPARLSAASALLRRARAPWAAATGP